MNPLKPATFLINNDDDKKYLKVIIKEALIRIGRGEDPLEYFSAIEENTLTE